MRLHDAVEPLEERTARVVAAPVVVIAVGVREEVAGEDRVGRGEGGRRGVGGEGGRRRPRPLFQRREVVGQRRELDLEMATDEILMRCDAMRRDAMRPFGPIRYVQQARKLVYQFFA